MNQLINSLVDKTAAMVPGVYTVEYESGKKGVEFNEEALNKFAELIVTQCAYIAYSTGGQGHVAHEEILGYFGVEQ